MKKIIKRAMDREHQKNSPVAHMLAGAAGGAMAGALTNPLDVGKTRLQVRFPSSCGSCQVQAKLQLATCLARLALIQGRATEACGEHCATFGERKGGWDSRRASAHVWCSTRCQPLSVGLPTSTSSMSSSRPCTRLVTMGHLEGIPSSFPFLSIARLHTHSCRWCYSNETRQVLGVVRSSLGGLACTAACG